MKGTILLHESDSELRKVIALHLEGLNWRVLQSKTVEFAMRLLEREEPKILVSEFEPPYSIKGGLINRFREINHDDARSILILTTLERLKKETIERYKPEVVVHKPFDVRIVSRNIDRFLGEDTSGSSLSLTI